jgi:hypothetical protein
VLNFVLISTILLIMLNFHAGSRSGADTFYGVVWKWLRSRFNFGAIPERLRAKIVLILDDFLE